MSCKALGIALKLSFEGNNQFIFPQTYFFILVVAAAVVTQVSGCAALHCQAIANGLPSPAGLWQAGSACSCPACCRWLEAFLLLPTTMSRTCLTDLRLRHLPLHPPLPSHHR